MMMKKTITFLSLLFIAALLAAQVPHRISYQSVIRDVDNNLVANSEIGMQISILQGDPEGIAVYVEQHFPVTNDNGLVSVEIGGGTVVSGDFDTVEWGADTYFIQTQTDLQGGSNYTITGVSQVLSVPYAFHALSAEMLTGDIEETDPLFSASPAAGIEDSDLLNWDEAYSWGDHALADYLTEETDPLFSASPAAGIEDEDILNWDEAYSWGDHSDAGYLLEESQSLEDVLAMGNDANESRIQNLGDPIEDQDAVNKAYVDLLEEKVDALLAYFENMENLPLISTSDISEVTSTTAAGGGNVINDGGSDILARGLVWHTEEMPTLANNEGYTEDGSGLGQFLSALTGLSTATTYYVRAYATNNNGTAYGSQVEFQTHDDNGDPGIIYGDGVTDIDGNEYVTVIIGDQEWMAENLRVTRYRNGDDIPSGLDNEDWSNTTDGAYAIFDHHSDTADGIDSPEEMVDAYGKLYNWYAAHDSGGLCPEGWHVPADAEWTQLVDYVVSQGYPNVMDDPDGAGNALKSCLQVDSPLGGDCDTAEHPRWNADETHHGFDAFGFSGLPGGRRLANGFFNFVGEYGFWWSTTDGGSGNKALLLDSSNGSMESFIISGKENGMHIRCVRDVSDEATTYQLNLDASPADAGTVTGAGAFEEGEVANVMAIPSDSWEFVNWTGDTAYLDDPDSPMTPVTMPANEVTLTAVFQAADDNGDSDIIYGDGVTDIDGNEYVTVIIGDQEWMAENLRVTKYNNGEAISQLIEADPMSESGTPGIYAIYDHNLSNTEGIDSPGEMVAAYGKLYNWYAVDNPAGLCPEGWSVPGEDEWWELHDYLSDQDFPNNDVPGGQGNALKSCRQLNSPFGSDCDTAEHPRWDPDETHHGLDAFGFSALPAGRLWAGYSFSQIGNWSRFWSATEFSENDAYRRGASSGFGSFTWGTSTKETGYSVRCVRD